MNRLKDKVAVITGSTSGIGAAMARLFAKEGATVVICGRRKKRGNALAQEIRKNGGGSIVSIGSMASTGGDLGATAYSAAKAGVDMLTKSVALQYGKQGVRCNCIRPGLIVTTQNEPFLPQFTKEVFLDNVAGTRYGRPEDIANMALFLASDESAYVTGQILDVDGGISCPVATVAQFRRGESHTWDH